MPLSVAEINDLTTATLDNYGPPRFRQIASRIADYEIGSRLLRKDNVMIDGGEQITRTLVLDHSGAAQMVGLFEEDNVDVTDVLGQISVPWRHINTFWAYDVREPKLNSGAQQIVNHVMSREYASMLSLMEKLEERGWTAPSSTDTKNFWGLPYWVVKNATVGFNGGAPSGWTTVGGLSPTDNTRWKNYTGTYTNISKSDLILTMRVGYQKIRFKSPTTVAQLQDSFSDNYRIYANTATWVSFSDVGESQNENLGRDIASMDGKIVFHRNPVVLVPKLDEDTTNPVYMLNFNAIKFAIMQGEYLRRDGPSKWGKGHNVQIAFIDLTGNIICEDRRSQAVFYYVA